MKYSKSSGFCIQSPNTHQFIGKIQRNQSTEVLTASMSSSTKTELLLKGQRTWGLFSAEMGEISGNWFASRQGKRVHLTEFLRSFWSPTETSIGDQTVWLCLQSAANLSLAEFPVTRAKYREIIRITVFCWADGHQVSSYIQSVGPPLTDNPNIKTGNYQGIPSNEFIISQFSGQALI